MLMPNNSMQRTTLRAAADAGRWTSNVKGYAALTVACWLTCFAATAGEPRRTPAVYEKVDTFVNEPLATGNPHSLAGLRKLGRVRSEKVVVVDNRHEPTQKDEIRTMEFDGLVIEAYFPARDYDNGFVTRIVISTPTWKLRHGLAVGAAAKDVEGALGQPDERSTGQIKYCGDTTCGTFFIREGRVREVLFEGSVD